MVLPISLSYWTLLNFRNQNEVHTYVQGSDEVNKAIWRSCVLAIHERSGSIVQKNSSSIFF